MPEYAGAEEIFHDQDAALEVAQAMFARAEPLTESTPAWAYLVKTRRLPAEAVRGALDQLRYLPPPIAGRPPQDHAVVSLLRDRAGEISGFQATFCDILGAATATEPRRLTCSLRVNGCRDGLFTAGGGAGQRCYLTEGFLEKSLAIAGLGIGPAYGSGGLNVLGFAVATEPEVVLVPDRPPAPDAWTRDGKTRLLDLHTKAYERAVDRLILAGRSVLMAAAPDCDHPCKDADAFLIRHGPIRLADLIERAIPVRLSDEGWKLRLAAMGPAEYDRARKKIADGLGVRVSTLDDMRKGGVSALPDFDDDSQIRDRLVSIAMTGELFHEDGGEAYAAVEIDGGGRTTFRVDRGAFTDWLLAEYGRRFPVVIGGREIPGSASATTIADAMRMIEALARNGEVRPVFLRVGWTDSALYIDMATREPAVIAVTTAGWRIITEAPVHLVHSRSAKPLPMPAPCSRKAVLRRLSEFFGFRPADDRFVLIVGIAVVALMPIGPYPILLLTGEQGSGKTSRSRWLKSVLDPTKALIRGRPKSAEDLAISVWRSWVACFDNLSKLDQDMSDWLCRLSEGGGLPKRKLFTDTEEILIEAARLIILTAIPDVARSGDLIDRAVLVRCEAIRSKVREQVLLSRFEAFLPNFLWYLVEAASCALGRLSGMAHSHDGLRRGDFVAWVEAAAPALGLKEGRFTEAYTRNQEQGVLLALEADPVARALLAYMDRRTTVEMSATLLLAELTPIAQNTTAASSR